MGTSAFSRAQGDHGRFAGRLAGVMVLQILDARQDGRLLLTVRLFGLPIATQIVPSQIHGPAKPQPRSLIVFFHLVTMPVGAFATPCTHPTFHCIESLAGCERPDSKLSPGSVIRSGELRWGCPKKPEIPRRGWVAFSRNATGGWASLCDDFGLGASERSRGAGGFVLPISMIEGHVDGSGLRMAMTSDRGTEEDDECHRKEHGAVRR